MTFNKTTAVAGGAAVLVALASAAMAQTPAPRPAAAPAPAAAARPAPPPITHGAAIPGICTYSAEDAMSASEVGKSVDARLKQILSQVNAELAAEKTAIENEARAIDAARATATPDAIEKRQADLQLRANAFQRKAQLREREIQATRQKALLRVMQELDPVAVAVYQQRQCAILLNEGVALANPQMDITAQVIAGLNAKIKSFTFDRERLDAPTPAAPTAPR